MTGAERNSLWAIASYFNPQRYRRRLSNYRRFRERLPLPLVTVELSFGGPFELRAGDAETLIQLTAGDVMWQKERLINIGRDALPDHCREVAWVDCDILIADDQWPARVRAALAEAPLAQGFERVHYLGRDVEPAQELCPAAADFWQTGFVSAVGGGQPLLESLRESQTRLAGRSALGFLWAARRELLDEFGLYDACIVGGGDVALTCAAYGCVEELERRQLFNERQRDRYRAWALPFHDAVRGHVAAVPGSIFHLWHGELHNRRGRERHEALAPFRFDPTQDLTLAPSGAWRWNSAKTGMHQFVRDYFVSRQEDG